MGATTAVCCIPSRSHTCAQYALTNSTEIETTAMPKGNAKSKTRSLPCSRSLPLFWCVCALWTEYSHFASHWVRLETYWQNVEHATYLLLRSIIRLPFIVNRLPFVNYQFINFLKNWYIFFLHIFWMWSLKFWVSNVNFVRLLWLARNVTKQKKCVYTACVWVCMCVCVCLCVCASVCVPLPHCALNCICKPQTID